MVRRGIVAGFRGNGIIRRARVHDLLTYEQYNTKSPWADQRVPQAANYAINRQAINEAETLGYSVLSGSIVPRAFAYAVPLEPYAYDPQKAKQLLTEAGYANGFDMGECSVDAVYAGVIEAIVNDLSSVGIRGRVRSLERAAFIAAHKEHTLKHLAFQGSGAFGGSVSKVEMVSVILPVQKHSG